MRELKSLTVGATIFVVALTLNLWRQDVEMFEPSTGALPPIQITNNQPRILPSPVYKAVPTQKMGPRRPSKFEN